MTAPSRTVGGEPLDAVAVLAARANALEVSEAEELGRLLQLLADPVRIRMLFALVAVESLSVGDLALSLGITGDQATYGLKMLRSAGLVAARREGRTIFYRLADQFPHDLLKHCLRQMLSIAGQV